MVLAKLGETDITKYINEKSYKMVSEPVFNEWTDANYTKHRDEVRRRIKGSFTLGFVQDSELTAFNTLLATCKSGNLLTISVYVGGDVNALTAIVCYYTMETASRREANANYAVSLVNFTVEER